MISFPGRKLDRGISFPKLWVFLFATALRSVQCAGALKKISADSGGELECKITAAKDILQQFSELQKEQPAIARSSDGMEIGRWLGSFGGISDGFHLNCSRFHFTLFISLSFQPIAFSNGVRSLPWCCSAKWSEVMQHIVLVQHSYAPHSHHLASVHHIVIGGACMNEQTMQR